MGGQTQTETVLQTLKDESPEQLELMAMLGAQRGKPLGPHTDHYFVSHRNVHWKRRQSILKEYPAVAELKGVDPVSQTWTVVLVGTQVALSVLLGQLQAPWWAVALLVMGFGAFVDHALWVLLHDFSHGCGAEGEALGNLWTILSNLAHVLPSGMSFKHYHLRHHNHLNTVGLDPDLPDDTEQRFLGRTAAGKALWLLAFPVWQATRVLLSDHTPPVNAWVVLNWVLVLGVNAGVFLLGGVTGFAYLFLSAVFSIGLHPVGARWIAEHYSIDAPQETYSTYGTINKVAFNIGYHNEHHDFPNIPWSRLPELRRRAPKYYEHMTYHTSYLRIFFAFIFYRGFTLHTRVVRKPGELSKKVE